MLNSSDHISQLGPVPTVMSTDNLVDDDRILGYSEGKTEDAVERENLEAQALVSYVEGRFARAKNGRYNDEQRMLAAYRNFRGIYGPDVQFSESEKNRSFIKLTKTKALAAHAQITEVLFAGNKFPIGVEATPVPEGIAESVHVDPAKQGMAGQPGGAPSGPQQPSGPQVSATIARPDILASLGPVASKLEPVKDQVEPGPGSSPTALTWEPAKIAARKMEKKFDDQLAEACADRALRSFVHELCVFGTGVFKGPLVKDKEYPKWSKDGKYEPVKKRVPEFPMISVWDAYPDPEARHADEMEDFTQRHKMSKTNLRELKKRPFFRGKSIDLAIKGGFNYHKEYWEDILEDYKNQATSERFEVLEYWGIVDTDIAEEAGLAIPEQYEHMDQVQVNVWVCNGYLLRLVFNPYTPHRIPYYICPYEVNPYSIFGIGVPENMLDTQLVMNGAYRAMIDNAVLSSNVVFEVDETNLVPGQNMKMTPGKIIRKNGGQAGDAVKVLSFPNVTNDWMMIFEKSRMLADEATGIPSYSHGGTGVQGMGRTAAGMSMLMGAAAQNIKAVVRNIDDYLLLPLGKALFSFNMQFAFDEEFIGDLEVVARGTESLMRNEVRSQKIMQLLEASNNPTDAPWIKRDYLWRELAESLEIEADKAVNDPREAGIQAMMMQTLNAAQGIPPGGAAPGGPGGSSVPQTSDPTGNGGGNIGAGESPTPGEAGFSSNGGSGGNPNQGKAPA